jgi:hypothetical protein
MFEFEVFGDEVFGDWRSSWNRMNPSGVMSGLDGPKRWRIPIRRRVAVQWPSAATPRQVVTPSGSKDGDRSLRGFAVGCLSKDHVGLGSVGFGAMLK